MTIARLNAQLASGKITQAEYASRVKQMHASASSNGSSIKNQTKKKTKGKKKKAQNGASAPLAGSGGGRSGRGLVGPPVAGTINRSINVKSDLEMYVAALASPENPSSAITRVPTRNSKYSATFQSSQTFPIMFDSAWTTDQGRFCVLAKPILGDAGGQGGGQAPPTTWKVCLADGNLGAWDNGTTWSSNQSYSPYSGGKDLRVDKFCPFFTAADPFLSVYYSGGTVTGLRNPLGTAPVKSEQNISTDYVQAAGPVGLTLLGPGNYLVSMAVVGTGLTGLALNVFVPPYASLVAATNGTQYQLTAIQTLVGGTTVLTFAWALTLFTSCYVGYTVSGTTVTSAVQLMSQVYQQYNDNTQNGGAIDRIRPVSMSLLVTCTVASLVNGGTIVGKLLNKSQCDKEFFVDVVNAETGQFQNWEALADTGNAYVGKFEDGARVIWLPEDDSDVDFLTPDESLTHSFPCALIAGQFTPGQTGFPSGQIAKCTLVTNYEITTSYTCLPGQKLSGNDFMMSEAFNIINQMPTATCNDGHWDYVKQIVARARAGAMSIGKWAWSNRETLLTTGAAVVSAL